MSVNIVVHHASGAILAVVTAQDGRPLDEIAGDVLPLVAGFDAEMEVPKQSLRAYALETADGLITDPMGQYVTVDADDKATPTPVVDTFTIAFPASANVIELQVTSSVVNTRRAWVLVKRAGAPTVDLGQKVIGQGSSGVAFAWMRQAGDVVLGLVEKERPFLAVAP
jgi:hypothetical protein